MSIIIIRSKLTPAQQQRLRRVARQAAEDFDNRTPTDDFCHGERAGWYETLDVTADPHAVARRMMVVAGTTFTYDVAQQGNR